MPQHTRGRTPQCSPSMVSPNYLSQAGFSSSLQQGGMAGSAHIMRLPWGLALKKALTRWRFQGSEKPNRQDARWIGWTC
jgi:hypothetical protein